MTLTARGSGPLRRALKLIARVCKPKPVPLPHSSSDQVHEVFYRPADSESVRNVA